MLAIVGVACLGVVVLNLPSQGALEAVQSGDALEYAATYRAGSAGTIGGSSYGEPLNISSPTAFLSTGSGAIAHYFFGPFVWEVRGLGDVVALLSTFIRVVLLLFAVREWRSSKGTSRSAYGFLLFVFLSLELLWATGTTNYGTAMRHHMVAYGIVVLLGAPRFSRFMVRLLSTGKPRAKNVVVANSTVRHRQ